MVELSPIAMNAQAPNPIKLSTNQPMRFFCITQPWLKATNAVLADACEARGIDMVMMTPATSAMHRPNFASRVTCSTARLRRSPRTGWKSSCGSQASPLFMTTHCLNVSSPAF